MTEIPADGIDRITPEIKDQLVEMIGSVRPLSRDFARGLNFGQSIQFDADGEGGLLETVLVRIEADAPPEPDLFYLGAVLGSIASRESQH